MYDSLVYLLVIKIVVLFFVQRRILKSFFNVVGIANRQDTLSETGHPCHYNIEDKSCGWCGLSSQQCNGWNLYYNNIKCGYLTSYAPGSYKRGDGFCLGQGDPASYIIPYIYLFCLFRPIYF